MEYTTLFHGAHEQCDCFMQLEEIRAFQAFYLGGKLQIISNCLLRYSRSKLPILIKMCCVVAVLCWFHTFPYPFQTWATLT